VIVVVDPPPALVEELDRAGLAVTVWTSRRAGRDVGFGVGAEAVVLAFPPGTHPLLENLAFRHATVIYAHAVTDAGTVGPATSADSAPCPVCLAQSRAAFDVDALGAPVRWVAASIAMEIELLRRQRVSTLFARALTWSFGEEPGLTRVRFGRREGCVTPGCVA
jgi:hypothetical protein